MVQTINDILVCSIKYTETTVIRSRLLKMMFSATKGQFGFMGKELKHQLIPTLKVTIVNGLERNKQNQQFYTFYYYDKIDCRNLHLLISTIRSTFGLIMSNQPKIQYLNKGISEIFPRIIIFLEITLIRYGKKFGIIGFTNKKYDYSLKDESFLSS
jgi:hypothetical protein